jgi:hypothetical protein
MPLLCMGKPIEGTSVETVAGNDNSLWGPLLITKFIRAPVDETENYFELTLSKRYVRNRPWTPIGCSNVEDSTLYR